MLAVTFIMSTLFENFNLKLLKTCVLVFYTVNCQLISLKFVLKKLRLKTNYSLFKVSSKY